MPTPPESALASGLGETYQFDTPVVRIWLRPTEAVVLKGTGDTLNALARQSDVTADLSHRQRLLFHRTQDLSPGTRETEWLAQPVARRQSALEFEMVERRAEVSDGLPDSVVQKRSAATGALMQFE